MIFKITNYKEGFEKQLESIMLEKPWTHFRRYNQAGFKALSSNKNFDSRINFIAYYKEEPIGYLLSNIEKVNNFQKAKMWLPIVRYGYEEAIYLLIERALSTYKELGISLVETNQGSEWDHLQGIPEKYGFVRTTDFVITVRKRISEFKIDDFPQLTPEQINLDKHEDLIINFYREHYEDDEEAAKNFIKNRLMRNDITHLLIQDNNLEAIIRFYLFNEPENHEAIRKIMWIRKFHLYEPKKIGVIQGLFRFSIEYAKKNDLEIIDFFNVAGDEDGLFQYNAINEMPYSHRYYYELEL